MPKLKKQCKRINVKLQKFKRFLGEFNWKCKIEP